MGLSHDDYMIAWICALPLEMAAAKVMLDETHPPLPQPRSDENAYTLGSISGHHIVVACLPSGVYGITSAAVVLANMRPTFPSLRFGLMVGIGGGVPSTTNDIRLGDVVVSVPTTNSGGVIQYDFGKALHDGDFQHTGSLNRPSQVLLTAVSQIRSNDMIGKKLAARFLSDVLQTQGHVKENFARPDKDWLFISDYKHHSDRPDCSMCDQSQLVDRDRRVNEEPVTHYGLIASGNQVMKDSKKRDSLAQSMDILCFEMEAAGLVDQFPCLVVRGICDYCDSHKHKEWQGYAALAAAAYVKELLSVVSLAATQSVMKPKYQVPLDLTSVPAIEEFIGRHEDLEHLWHYLQPAGSTSQKVAILHGLGGIGKTQLAIQFARMHKHDFTAIFWLAGKDRSTLVRSLSSCLPRIQTHAVANEAATEEEAEQRASQVLKWLAGPENQNWLLIFDNIDQYTPLETSNNGGYDIKDLFPKADHGSMIITSRLQRLTELGKSFPIERLTLRDARKLCLQNCGRSLSEIVDTGLDQDLVRLMTQLDGLPLAISIASAFMRETGTGIREYLNDYQESWSELQAQSTPTRHYHQGNILQTWAVSYHEIQKRDPTAAVLLLFLSFFDNQDIWYELIACGRHCANVPDWFETAVGTKFDFKARIKTLLAFSLIETKPQGGSYRLHPVVQGWCIHVAATENRISRLRELALVCIGYMVPGSDERDYARVQQRLLPHADYLFQKQMTYEANDTAICGAFLWLGNLYSDQGKLKEAEVMYQRALAGYEQALGPDHMFTLDTVNSLGSLYKHQDKLKEAEMMYQRALAGYEQAFSPDYTPTLLTINNLGNLYKHQGKLKEAEIMYQRALARCEQALGPDHTYTLIIINNLGSLYSNQGKVKEAEMMYQHALAGFEQALGPDHTSTLNILDSLGNLYKHQDKLKEAEMMYQRALAGYEQALGPDHTSTLFTVSNLGNLYKHQDKLKKAEIMYQRALAGYKQALGPDHISTLATMHNLGSLYFDQDKLKEAEVIYQHVLAGCEQALGPDHTSTLLTVHNLKNLYKHQGKLKEAEVMNQRALAGYEQALGPNQSETREVSRNLGALTRLNSKGFLGLQDSQSSRVQAFGNDSKNTVTKSRKRDALYKVFSRK